MGLPKDRGCLLFGALLAVFFFPRSICYSAEDCEMTLETFVRVKPGSPEVTPSSEMSPAARFDLGMAASPPSYFDFKKMKSGTTRPKAIMGPWHLTSRRTISFPPPGHVRIVALPKGRDQTTAVELRSLKDIHDVFYLDRSGIPVGSPVAYRCPHRYYTGFGGVDDIEGRAIAVSIHPKGPIEQDPRRHSMEIRQ